MTVETTTLPNGADEKAAYMQLLLRDFHALEHLIKEGKLEQGTHRIGAELELNILDEAMEPAPIGDVLLSQLGDGQFTTEFSRFNLEVNSEPIHLTGSCFSKFSRALSTALAKVEREARRLNCSVLMTGIIPTLHKEHIPPEALTPNPRYQALYELRRTLKGEQYEYRIRGVDDLLTRDNIALFAGCVTSFQAHLQIDLEDFTDSFNWAQLIAGPILSCAPYSPLFLGKRLWHETRVALFEQAADTRNPDTDLVRHRPRVFFGDEWLKGSIVELFQEDIANFEPLFTLAEADDPRLAMERGEAPDLDAWNMFNGSIYRWNRVCYGKIDGSPSLRIENRILPSGPTIEDMMANLAFWTGTMAGLPQRYRSLSDKMDFAAVKENFFTAARHGLDVAFRWVDGSSPSAQELILDELLPIARQGLKSNGVDVGESDHYLDIIEARVKSGRTGSRWMIDSYTELLKTAKRDEALMALTSGMIARQKTGAPAHTWMAVEIDEAGDWRYRYDAVHKIMTTDLYKVGVDDTVDLVAHIMEWKRVGHIPVEDAKGRLAGVITKDTIINYMINRNDLSAPSRVGDLMVVDPLTVDPKMPLEEAIRLLLENEISCLPVVSEEKVVGIVTERDFVEITKGLVAELKHVNDADAYK